MSAFVVLSALLGAGCFGVASRRAGVREYQGYWTTGRNESAFRACQDALPGLVWLKVSDQAMESARRQLPGDAKDGPVRRYFVRVRGVLSPEGSYGYLGLSPRQLEVRELLTVRAPSASDCR